MEVGRRFPPGPQAHRPWSFLRTLRSLARLMADPYGFVLSRFEEHGDLYHVDEGGGSHLFVTRHPDRIREVLVERAADFRKGGGANDRLKVVLGNGLLTSDGELWKRQRRLMQPHFRAKVVNGYAEQMVAYAEELHFSDGQQVDLSDEMMALTLRIVCRALFDHDVRDATDRVGRGMEALRSAATPSPLPSWLPTPGRRRQRRSLEMLDQVISDLVDEREREGLRTDLLSLLLGVEGGMSRQQLRDELVTLFLAGHETTSHAITWTWYLLSQHPEAEARLHAELDEVLGDRPPTRADLAKLPWVTAVVSEAMRLFPPAYVVARVAARDTELGGYPLVEGDQVTCWIWHCHHDARWFDEPEAFRPERFVEGNFPKHAWIPFGAGTRMCIGSGFAMMEAQLLVASLGRRYRFEAVDGQVVVPLARVTLSPKDGLNMRVSRRRRS